MWTKSKEFLKWRSQQNVPGPVAAVRKDDPLPPPPDVGVSLGNKGVVPSLLGAASPGLANVPAILPPAVADVPQPGPVGFTRQGGSLVLQAQGARVGNGDRSNPEAINNRLLARALTHLAPARTSEKVTDLDNLVFLAARHFRHPAVPAPDLLPECHGREWYRQAIGIGSNQAHLLAKYRLPSTLSHRIALGFAKFSFNRTSKPLGLHVGDFPTADIETFDKHRTPSELEKVPASPRGVHEFEEMRRASQVCIDTWHRRVCRHALMHV